MNFKKDAVTDIGPRLNYTKISKFNNNINTKALWDNANFRKT